MQTLFVLLSLNVESSAKKSNQMCWKLRSKENANVAFALLLEHAKPARIIGLGNARAKMFLELAHVSLFADYGDLEAATTVEPVLSGTVLSDQFFKSRKLLLLMYCNFDLY